jgi:hypothetical protein
MKSVKATDINTPAIIGTFEGECADANITNKNGLDITREVWETVFASEEYADGIKNLWFLGYLGHPADPGDQHFQDACIVMTEGYIADNGKIYGKFNLIDTPVGRIVKTFIDAGVKFGISVRGAGDIYNNSVDPDTFVFRGFDLVAFPAYPESIPEFTAIAASTDAEKQAKYKAVCAAVRTNLQSITSAESLDVIQAQFAKQSDEYKMIENKKDELKACEASEEPEEELDINAQRIEGMTQLYLDTKAELIHANETIKQLRNHSTKRISRLKKVNASLEEEITSLSDHINILESTSTRKMKSIERITASQMSELSNIQQALEESNTKYKTVKLANSKIKIESAKLVEENKKLITANKELENKNKRLENSNLIYKQRIEATANDIQQKDSIISDLQSELSETVTAATDTEVRTSNLDAKIKKLQQDLSAATKLIQEYQDAYAYIYASAIGVRLEDVRVTSATTVKELQAIIGSSQVQSRPAITDAEEIVDIEYLSDPDNGDDLVTL